jgi:hypothetical protein
MKKTILVGLFMALLSTTQAQISVNIPVGFSTIGAPTAGLNLQAGIGSLILATGFDSHISAKSGKGQYFWGRIGAGVFISELNKIEISCGIGHYRVSADIKGANKSLALVNAQYVHQTESRPELALFGGFTATKEFAMFTGGIRFTFGRNNSGCYSKGR